MKKIHEYDVMRVLATILVVIGHSAYLSMETPLGGVDYSGLLSLGTISQTIVWQRASGLIRWIYSFHMPLFFLISGAVFMYEWNQGKYRELTPFLIKKAKRLLVPAAAYGILWVIPVKLAARFYNGVTAAAAVTRTYSSETGQLWFLYTLFYIFLIAFLLLNYFRMGEKKRVLLFVTLALVPLQNVLEINILGQTDVFYYLIFFLLGCCFENSRSHFETDRYWLKAVCMVFCFLLSVFLAEKREVAVTFWKPVSPVYDMLYIAAVSLGIYYLSSLLKKCLIQSRGYQLLQREAFHIYLLHDPLNYLILFAANKMIGTGAGTEIAAFLLFMGRTAGVFLVSLFLGCLITGSSFRPDGRILPGVFGICLYVTAFNMQRDVGMKWIYDEPGFPVKACFTASEFTEDFWNNGISSEHFAVLAPYDRELYEALSHSEALYTGDVRSEILRLENAEDLWIFIYLDRDCDIVSFSYPNKIMAY